MIISASRRTDIPAFYSDWLINRFREGFALVRNPMNPRLISKVSLSDRYLDGIVFWTKNPIPMLDKLPFFDRFAYYFQFTVTPYGKDLEPNVPNKKDHIIPAFQSLSRSIGRERVIWRYDPIAFTQKYSPDLHIRCFEEIAKRFSGYTEKCVISFVDMYRNTASGMKPHVIYSLSSAELEKAGIKHGRCIDPVLFEKLLGCRIDGRKGKNQRGACGCMESIDIGMYDTCKNGCRYCYAIHSPKTLQKNLLEYDALSPILCGKLQQGDEIKERKITSLKVNQMQLGFDL